MLVLGEANVPEIKPAVLEALVSMIVHDLRNPTATLGANISFVREVLGDESVPREEVDDALADAQQALYDLMRGLDQVSWIGRWCNERSPTAVSLEPLRTTFEKVRARVRYGELSIEQPPAVSVRGGDALERLIDLLIANGHQHAPRTTVQLSAVREGESVIVEVADKGKPLAPELAQQAFSLEGQTAVKGRSQGRYSRVAGLFTASILAQALGATLEAVERDGNNVFRVRLAVP
jgi:K+-sensing histidine kinase KdpD